ncbi:putative Rep [Syntrophobacter sp. SbD1]|nr:putative Rep [Syntrophobacter sp. SbD1]
MAYLMEEQARGSAHPPGGQARALGASSETVASLGIHHELAVPLESAKHVLWRLRRYRLQSYAREIMSFQMRGPGLEHRVAYCLRAIAPKHQTVQIWKKQDQARYKGLMVCGSIWVCPVCAARISDFRRQHLTKAVDDWTRAGGMILMLSQTAPHHRNDPLKDLLLKFSKGRVLMHNRKAWRTWVERNGLVGSVRALEVNYGIMNGWHIHIHELLFFKNGFHPDRFHVHADLYYQWENACHSVGLEAPTFHRGINVQDARFAAGYAAKWGIESEITKSHVKHAKGGNFGPFDMLEEYGQGTKNFDRLFREYEGAFRGKKQLQWSHDLWKLLHPCGEKEKSDQEVAEKIEDNAVFLGSLDRKQWARVVAAEKRGELLEVASVRGWNGVLELIGNLF